MSKTESTVKQTEQEGFQARPSPPRPTSSRPVGAAKSYTLTPPHSACFDRFRGIAQTLPTRSFAEAGMRRSGQLQHLNCVVSDLGPKMKKGFVPKREMSPEISIRVSEAGRRYVNQAALDYL